VRRTGKLSYKTRSRLPSGSFVFPPSPRNPRGKYPIDTANRARNALARVSTYGTSYEKSAVCAAVHKHYPEIHSQFCKMH